MGLEHACRKSMEVVVTSMSAQFYLIKRSSLAPLPDVVQASSFFS